MNREDIVLAALAPAEGVPHSPVQVQKLLFLIDRNVRPVIECEAFDFQPYNYGPFDKAVYSVLESLREQGMVAVSPDKSWRTYSLTSQGQLRGVQALEQMPDNVQRYMMDLSAWVRSLSFSKLVLAIYEAYPEMRVNSVFQSAP